MRLSLKVTLSSVLLFAVIQPGLSAAQTLRNGNTETTPQAVQSLALKAADVTPLTGMSRQAAARAANAAPATMHERFAAFLADRGFQSYLVLQNLRLDAPVTVTPVLVLSQGEIPLDSITMPPHTTTTVDINDALLAHGVTDTRGAV